jgi:spore germination protein YaaH
VRLKHPLLGASAIVAGLVLPAAAGAALPTCRGNEAIELRFERAVGTLSGRMARCEARLVRTVRFQPPYRPAGLAVVGVRRGSVRLVWSRSKAGDGRLTGYRVYRDGRSYRRVRGRSLRVRTGHAHTYRVAAADTRGHVGPQSNPVRVVRGHHAPRRPAKLRVTRVRTSEVRLSWAAAERRSGRIAGYRIYRNKLMVRQVRGLAGADRNLASATSYRFAVAAVDTQGYMSASTAPVAVTTARPAATQGRAHAFLLASTGESFRDLQRHYRQIGYVYPTYFDCRTSDGAITGRDDALVTGWSRLRGIEVHARFNCQDPAPLHSVLTQGAVRARTLDRLVELARDHGYDGINVDFENGAASDRDALTSFVSDLGARLHTIGKRVSVEVSAKYEHTTTGRSGLYDYEALGRAADRVFVMNWGWHWSTSEPGAPDDMELCRKVADYVASIPNRSRFVLGTHLYGMDWPNGGGPANEAAALEYADVRALMEHHGAQPVLDPLADAWVFNYTDSAGVPHEVWYADAATISRRVRLARDRGLGIGFWRLGREDPSIWNDPQIAPGSAWP